MLKLNENSKVYIYCPAGVVTGGIELLHQLSDLLNRKGVDAYIVYLGREPHEIPSEYKSYQVKTTEHIIDEADNLIVYYEAGMIISEIQSTIKKAQILFWWLSIDNYFKGSKHIISLTDHFQFDKLNTLKIIASRVNNLIMKRRNYFKNNISFAHQLSDKRIIHAYQSEYARVFLDNRGIKTLVPLKDYINIDHTNISSMDNKEDREDIILYNPKKGLQFTKKIIAQTPDLNWIPIENMTRLEVVDLMKKSKLYVDFGNHPGKDRLPRECAMNRCCIITGSRGAAYYFEDIAIDAEYKFDEKTARIDDIALKIRSILSNYSTEIDKFDNYRSKILTEKNEFEEQVYTLFFL
jgi:hypothetical protein